VIACSSTLDAGCAERARVLLADAIILAIAISPINLRPHQRDALHEGKRLAAEFQVSDRRVEQVSKETLEQGGP